MEDTVRFVVRKWKVGEVEWLSNESLTEQQYGGFIESSTVKPVTEDGEQE